MVSEQSEDSESETDHRASPLSDVHTGKSQTHHPATLPLPTPMATPGDASSSQPKRQTNGQMHTTGSALDTLTGPIVTEKLTGENYRDWAQAVKLSIGGRGKKGFLTGDSKAPADPSSPEMQQWEINNSMVSSWLINAMAPHLQRSFMYLPTASDIWEALRVSYSDEEDLSQLYGLKTQIWQLKQGTRTVTNYWLELVALWQEVDLHTEEEVGSPAEAARKKQSLEKERLFQFLAGLDPIYDEVRSCILSRTSVPSTLETFSEVR